MKNNFCIFFRLLQLANWEERPPKRVKYDQTCYLYQNVAIVQSFKIVSD